VLQSYPLQRTLQAAFSRTIYSLAKLTVAFVQIVKALEPAFAAVLSAAILGTRPTISMGAALVVLFLGVVLVSFTELQFDARALAAGLGSNLVFQFRNVLSKRDMTAKPLCSVGRGPDGSACKFVRVRNFACVVTSH
jgi:solute carrier family 35 protein E1